MRSMVHALTWEYVHKIGWLLPMTFGGSLIFLLVYASIASVTPAGLQDGDPVQSLLEVALLPAVIFITVLGLGSGVWPVSRLYTKPISNLSITSWIIGSGLVMLLVQLPLVIWCYNHFFNAGWPLLGAVLFSATLWVVAQPFFLIGTRSFSRLVLTGLPLGLMLVWYMSRYGLLSGPRHDWAEVTAGEIGLLAVTFAAFCFFTHSSVAADRCGESARATALRQALIDWLQRWNASRAERRMAFRSARTAQFWYQWRGRGWCLTWAISLVMLVIVVVFSYQMSMGRGSWRDLPEALAGIPGFICFGCLFYGLLLGFDLDRLVNTTPRRRSTSDLSDADALGSFLATRPISDATIARVNLAVCALTLAVALGVWLVVYLGAHGLVMAAHGWQQMASTSVTWQAHVLLTGSAWILASNGMTIVCTGRLKRWMSWGGVWLVTYTAILIALMWLTSRQTSDAFMTLTGVGFSLAVLAATILCYAAALQRRLIRWSSLSVVIPITVMTYGFIVWQVSKPIALTTWLTAAMSAALCVLPWAALPLAIAHNRHR